MIRFRVTVSGVTFSPEGTGQVSFVCTPSVADPALTYQVIFSDGDGEVLTAQAGATLARVASMAQEAGLAGLEFAGGIPGTLGGGVAMNAGAYSGQLSDVLIEACVLRDGEEVILSREVLEMGYRVTLPLKRGLPVLWARFRLTRDDPAAILARMKELNARRREKQPLSFPSAGSTF